MPVNISDFSVARQRSIKQLTNIPDLGVSPPEKLAFLLILLDANIFFMSTNISIFIVVISFAAFLTACSVDFARSYFIIISSSDGSPTDSPDGFSIYQYATDV